jgi:pyruvate, water dikinase
MEFIITHMVKVHPMALIKFDELKDEEARKQIGDLPEIIRRKRGIFC